MKIIPLGDASSFAVPNTSLPSALICPQAGYPPGTLQARIADPGFDPYNLSDPHVHFVEWIDRDLRSYSGTYLTTNPFLLLPLYSPPLLIDVHEVATRIR